MAKRERDGWRVVKDTKDEFRIANAEDGWLRCYALYPGHVSVDKFGYGRMPPARALQFAAKLQAIAEKAAKEVR